MYQEQIFFLQIKKGYLLVKNNFVGEVAFKKTEYLKAHDLKNIHSIITDD